MHQNDDFFDGARSYICDDLVSFIGAIGLVKLPYVFQWVVLRFQSNSEQDTRGQVSNLPGQLCSPE